MSIILTTPCISVNRSNGPWSQGPTAHSGEAAGQRAALLGLPVDLAPDPLARAAALVCCGGQVVTLNAEMTMAALADPCLHGVISRAELVVPDGAGVVWALRLRGRTLCRKPGIELAEALLHHAARDGWRVALVGAQPDRLQRAARYWLSRLPHLQVVRLIHGYQPPQHWPTIEAELQGLKPDLVLVALGTPRQELWINQARPRGHGVWMGVGGSFDVWSGASARAPQWIMQLQLEWLHRLLQQPHRWHRALALPRFAWIVMRDLTAETLNRKPPRA